MVTIIRQPGNQFFALNPIAFRLQTNQYLLTPAQRPKANIFWEFFDYPVAGNIIDITCDWGYSLVLTFVASNPGTNQLTGYVSGSAVTYYNNLVSELRQNTIIGTFFDVVATNPGNGGAYWITLVKRTDSPISIFGNTGNFSTSKSNVVAPATYRPNFSFLLELFVEQVYRSGVYGKVNASQLPNASYKPIPKANNQADVYINNALLDYLTFDLPQLPADNILVKRCDNIQVRWWCRITERYGNPVVTQPWSLSRERSGFAVKAGLNDESYTPGYNPIPAESPSINKWMTECPEKEVLPGQPEWLCFRRDDSDIAKVVIRVTFANGTLYSSGLAPQISEATINAVSQANDIVMIEAGYDQLNLGAIPTASSIVSWEMQLLDASNNDLYAPRKYKVKDQPFLHLRYFIFQNSKGGVDTLRCTGKLTKVQKVERVKAYRAREYAYQLPERLVISKVTDEETMYEISTGHITKAYSDYLQEFMRSEYVYEYRNGAYYPVLIEPGSYERFIEDSGMYSVSFKFIAAYEEKIY